MMKMIMNFNLLQEVLTYYNRSQSPLFEHSQRLKKFKNTESPETLAGLIKVLKAVFKTRLTNFFALMQLFPLQFNKPILIDVIC